MRTFGGFIRQGRKAIGLTQREFAARILFEDGHAISLPYLNHLEHNLRKPPRAHMFEQFAEALGVKCEVLFFWSAGYRTTFKSSTLPMIRSLRPFGLFAGTSELERGEGSSTVSLRAVRGAANGRISHDCEDDATAVVK
jgi:transcriptional regulator with XRE-family HTH domain